MSLSHQHISFVKSAVRIVGYAILPASIVWGAFILTLAEGIGIWEEIGY